MGLNLLRGLLSLAFMNGLLILFGMLTTRELIIEVVFFALVMPVYVWYYRHFIGP